MDPGTILAVVEISGIVLGKIWKYYRDVKGAKDEIERLIKEVESSQTLCQQLQRLLNTATDPRKLPASASLDDSIKQALLDVQSLNEKLEPSTRHRLLSKVNTKALKWPLTKGDAHELIARLERFKSAVTVALSLDQT